MMISKDIVYVGVNDHQIDLFEGQYKVPHGMSYNSYVILDEKIAVMDSVDEGFKEEWLNHIKAVLKGREPDYLVVQHMEPDHSANVQNFLDEFPNSKVVASPLAFMMMRNTFGTDFSERRIVVKEKDTLSLGKHVLTFVNAPLVHWPEVIMTYDSVDKVLFSADAFGKFGAVDIQEEWIDEARRYYVGIVGKFGAQVQALLKKVSELDIKMICPLHGPVLKENLNEAVKLYDLWSSYQYEEKSVVIAYASVYGNTKKAAELLKGQLESSGIQTECIDLARTDLSKAVAEAFRCSHLVLASTTYMGSIFPCMRDYLHELIERNFQNRTVSLIENGTWAPNAVKVMSEMLKHQKLNYTETKVRITSSLNETSMDQIQKMAEEIRFSLQNN